MILNACSGNSEKDRYVSIVEEWQGKQIVLPDDMTDFLTGDTIDLSDADFTILTYVDSTGCTECSMKLPLWNEYMKTIDSITDLDILPLMIIHSNDEQDVSYLLQRDSYNYPVYIDTDNYTYRRNLFLNDNILSTFLLDKNHKVVAIGNPIYSQTIANLYKSILSGKKIFNLDMNSVIQLSENKFNLGKLQKGDIVSRNVTITNLGNDTVYINKIVPSCECINAFMPKGYICPNKDNFIEITYTGDSTNGYFEKIINIYIDEFDYALVISAYGEITE